MRIGLRQLPSDKNLSSTVERKPLRCRLGMHCRHPRVVRQAMMDHAGNEWTEKVIKHDDNGRYIQIHTADHLEVTYFTDHKGDWQTITTGWKCKCCRCGHIKWWMERRTIHDVFKNHRISKEL